MSENTTIEQPLTTVENELRNLKRKIESTDSWYDRMTGAFENDPAFDEVLALGRQFRESQGQASLAAEGGKPTINRNLASGEDD